MSSPTYASSSAKGTSVYRNTALQATKAAVKTSRGRVYGFHINNTNGSDAFVQLYDSDADGVTVGTTTPTLTLTLKASSALTQTFNPPIEFNAALTVAATTTVTGSTDPTTGLLVQILYV